MWAFCEHPSQLPTKHWIPYLDPQQMSGYAFSGKQYPKNYTNRQCIPTVNSGYCWFCWLVRIKFRIYIHLFLSTCQWLGCLQRWLKLQLRPWVLRYLEHLVGRLIFPTSEHIYLSGEWWHCRFSKIFGVFMLKRRRWLCTNSPSVSRI